MELSAAMEVHTQEVDGKNLIVLDLAGIWYYMTAERAKQVEDALHQALLDPHYDHRTPWKPEKMFNNIQ